MKHERSEVVFADLRAGFRENLLKKVGRLFRKAGLAGIVSEHDTVAIKFHVGEAGGTAYLRPDFIRAVVEEVEKIKGRPFLAETNTLYHGLRSNAIDHLKLAASHGFTLSVSGAPLLICDGLMGQNHCALPVESVHQTHVSQAYIASDIVRADALLSVAHFKLHLGAGFGGAIKNVAMGCASVAGKLALHCTVRPQVEPKACTACGRCLDICLPRAIEVKGGSAGIDSSLCTGCAECIAICPQQAIRISWDATARDLQERMIEYLYAIHQHKRGKIGYINFLTQITPGCDCMPFSDAPIVPDIGILASLDPVAIDQASIDLVNQATGLPGTALREQYRSGQDKARAVYPDIDWEPQLAYGERLGLGTRSYHLISLK